MNQGNGRIVEFIGIAGAGKSTLCRFAMDQLRQSGIRTIDAQAAMQCMRDDGFVASIISRMGRPSKAAARLERRWRWMRRRAFGDFRKRHPQAAALLDARFDRLNTECPDEAKIVKPWVRNDAALFELLGQTGSDWSLCLWEEGIALRCVNLFALVTKSDEKDGLEEFVSAWPLPDALVYVHVDLDTAFDRIEARGRPKRLIGASDETAKRFLQSSARVVEALLSEARRRGVPVFKLDNNDNGKPTTQLSGWTDCASGLIQIANSVDNTD